MIEKVVKALESEFKKIHITPQEKVQQGSLFITLDDIPIEIKTMETYTVQFTYCIRFVEYEIIKIEEMVKKIILALETIDIKQRYLSSDKSISLEGAYYVVSLIFQIDEEVYVP